MIYYLNFGFILEQALVDIVKKYIDRQRFDEVYDNFHISVVNQHPFAHMIIDENARAADLFPSIVITTQSDSKPSDLTNLPPHTMGIGYTSSDIDKLIASTQRAKTRIDKNGEVVVIKKNNQVVYETIPGYVLVTDTSAIEKLKTIADSRTSGGIDGMVYGLKVDTRRRDRISVEIWSENNQLKNEIYEHLRIMFSSILNQLLRENYALFDPSIFDNSVNGERSSNYNFDFDVMLNGSHITFEVDYNVSQIIFDTEIENLDYEIVTKVMNHIKL